MFDAAMVTRAMQLEPATEQELEDAGSLRPGDYEIYSENLNLMLQEGKEVMTKMGISSMLHSGDTLVAVYTAQGDLVSAVLGTYLHSVTGQVPIKFILDRASPTIPRSVSARVTSTTAMRRSTAGSTTRISSRSCPSSAASELIGWVVSGAHQSETGGSEPGGEVTQAHTRHDEGMKLTPIKIGEQYRLRNDLLLMMENFISRAPRMQVTDVKARVAACDRVRVRLQGLAGKRGNALLRGLFRRMIQQTSAGVRQRIESWPDGIYRHNVFMDTTGHEDGLLRASVAVEVSGRSADARLLRDLSRARGLLQRVHERDSRSLRREPVPVPVPRLPDLLRDARPHRHPGAARNILRRRSRGGDQLLTARRGDGLSPARGGPVEGDVLNRATLARVRLHLLQCLRGNGGRGEPARRAGHRLHGLSAQRLRSRRALGPGRDRRLGVPARPLGQGAGRGGHRVRVPAAAPLPEAAARHLRVRQVPWRPGRGGWLRRLPDPASRLHLEPEGVEVPRPQRPVRRLFDDRHAGHPGAADPTCSS